MQMSQIFIFLWHPIQNKGTLGIKPSTTFGVEADGYTIILVLVSHSGVQNNYRTNASTWKLRAKLVFIA